MKRFNQRYNVECSYKIHLSLSYVFGLERNTEGSPGHLFVHWPCAIFTEDKIRNKFRVTNIFTEVEFRNRVSCWHRFTGVKVRNEVSFLGIVNRLHLGRPGRDRSEVAGRASANVQLRSLGRAFSYSLKHVEDHLIWRNIVYRAQLPL